MKQCLLNQIKERSRKAAPMADSHSLQAVVESMRDVPLLVAEVERLSELVCKMQCETNESAMQLQQLREQTPVPIHIFREQARLTGKALEERDAALTEVERLKTLLEAKRDSAQWVRDRSLGDNWPLPHWRCTGCGDIVGCHRQPDRRCETCQQRTGL